MESWIVANASAGGVGALCIAVGMPDDELPGKTGALLVIEAIAVWLLRRWARKHPARGRALAAPFERRAQAEREELAAREARHARRGRGEPRVLAGFVFGRRPRIVAEASGAAPAAGVSAPAADALVKVVRPGRSFGRGLYVTWIGLSMILWPAAAWIFAGMMAAAGIMSCQSWNGSAPEIRSEPILRYLFSAGPVVLASFCGIVVWKELRGASGKAVGLLVLGTLLALGAVVCAMNV